MSTQTEVIQEKIRFFYQFALFGMIACGPKVTTQTTQTPVEPPPTELAKVLSIQGITAIHCSIESCDIETKTGAEVLQIDAMTLSHSDREPSEPLEPWPNAQPSTDFNTIWNTQVANKWRSPFQVDIPAPSGGFYRSNRGVGPGSSRIMRLGGSVVTARQGLDPGSIAYPRNLALHPTGTEAYHIVWPNPDLIAFNARTMETTWRIRLDGPALGLFISENGRYLLAELDGETPDHQMLDYEPHERTPPDDSDPWGDTSLQWLDRPTAKRTVLVDLALGEPVAIVPGTAIGLHLTKDGAIVAASEGVAKVTSSNR